jgi:hypothetical protein
MTGADNLSGMLGGESQKLSVTNQTQALGDDAGPSYFLLRNYAIRILDTNVLVEEQNINDAGIWTHPVNGVWGDMVWGGATLGTYQTIYNNEEEFEIPVVAQEKMADFMAQESAAFPEYLALGSGLTSYATSDTQLYDEFYRDDFDSYVNSTTGVSESTIVLSTAITSIHGTTVKEIGTFNHNLTGTLFSRHVIGTPFTPDASHNYRITVKKLISNASAYNALITYGGINKIRDWMVGEVVSPPIYLAYGDGTTGILQTDTVLEGELDRYALDRVVSSGNKVEYGELVEYASLNGETLRKSGLYDDPSAGTLWIESMIIPISKTDQFQIREMDNLSII